PSSGTGPASARRRRAGQRDGARAARSGGSPSGAAVAPGILPPRGASRSRPGISRSSTSASAAAGPRAARAMSATASEGSGSRDQVMRARRSSAAQLEPSAGGLLVGWAVSYGVVSYGVGSGGGVIGGLLVA